MVLFLTNVSLTPPLAYQPPTVTVEQALNLFPRPLVTLSKTQTLVGLVVLTLDQYEITYHPATPLFEHPLGKRCLL